MFSDFFLGLTKWRILASRSNFLREYPKAINATTSSFSGSFNQKWIREMLRLPTQRVSSSRPVAAKTACSRAMAVSTVYEYFLNQIFQT